MKLSESWCENKVKITKQGKDCAVIEYGCSGKGIVPTYQLSGGISLCFPDFDTKDIMPSQQSNPNIISIACCYNERYECEFSNHQVSYLPEGSFAAMGTKYLPLFFSSPLKKRFAFSLVIDIQSLSSNFIQLLDSFDLNIDKISEYLRLDENGCLCHAGKELGHIFSEIYEAKDINDTSYFRIKAIEFLFRISKFSYDEDRSFQYYDKKYIQKAEEICNYIIEHLNERVPLRQLTAEKDFNLFLFHKVFTQIYGDTPYAYIKKYKMNIAANELKNTDRKVNDIALSLDHNNASKFSIAFHSAYGTLPKDYRRQNN